ncbi:MAG: UDP-N-acetylmuramate dehydrogenase [Clostridiaceae bacterium]|nr:UDP-N-acetylmuramate dehydrogenase [Clostridiaceae bacterium]
MKEHTTMKVGGKAALMIIPESISCIQKFIAFLKNTEIPYMIIGNGSNLIFRDSGYNGVIIKLGAALSAIEVNNNIISAMAGSSLAHVASVALEHSLTGLEFASGIPGSIGGAVCMNAGAYDGEMRQVVEESLCIDKDGNLITLKGNEHNFSYRHSRLQDDDLTCLQVKLRLEKGEKSLIQAKMNELNARRREKQPLNFPSAGSIFKRPPGSFAGKLIDDCGLRGTKIGGAQVSDKHCGFIVNTGNATAEDIISLVEYVRDSVYKSSGIKLELEVKIVGGS